MAYFDTTGGASAYQRRERSSLTGVWNAQRYPYETVVTVPSVDYAITLADAKSFLRVAHNQDDNYIELLIAGVTEEVERYIGVDTFIKTRQSFWSRYNGSVHLPYGPHGTISSVVAQDIEGNQTTLTLGTDYYVEGINQKYLQITNGVGPYLFVTYESGYVAGSCPAAIRGAMLQEISLQYKNRNDPNTPIRTVVNGLTVEAMSLLQSYIRYYV